MNNPEYPPSKMEPVQNRPSYAAAILGGPAKYTINQLATETGLTVTQIENYWLWLGIPARDADEAAYTEADLESLKELRDLIHSEQMDDATFRTLVRAVGHSTERLAAWQAEAIVDHLARLRELDDPEARQAVVDSFPNLIAPLSRQLDHAWRRATVVILDRFGTLDDAQKADETATDSTLLHATGFADIVGYTSLAAKLSEKQLAEFIVEVEQRARDIVTSNHGWVIKTIGDAVMFGARTPEDGAKIAVELATARRRAEDIRVRVGLTFGRVVARFGDAFGTSVNLAARLTALAEPGTVLTDSETARLLAGDYRFRFIELPETEIKGLGVMRPYRLESLPG